MELGETKKLAKTVEKKYLDMISNYSSAYQYLISRKQFQSQRDELNKDG